MTAPAVARRWGAVLVVVVALAACTPSGGTPTTATTTMVPVARTVLRVAVAEWPSCLNPLLCDDRVLHEQVLQHVLPRAYEINADGEYTPSPLLNGPADIDTTGPDEMTISYRITPAARWADGTPITSSDFVGTWRAVLETPGADTTGYRRITDVDDADPRVAEVTISPPYGDWRDLFGGADSYLLQADAFGASPNLENDFVDELPMAAGPFQLTNWSDTEATLARVDAFWPAGRDARVDQVRLRHVDPADVTFDDFDVLALGDAAVGTDVPPGYTTVTTPSPEIIALWFDQRGGQFQNRDLRLALARVVDREALLAALTDLGAAVTPLDCVGWLPGLGPWCDAAAIDPLRPTRAVGAILQAAGFARDEPDGPWLRDGELLSVSVRSDPGDPLAAALVPEVRSAIETIAGASTSAPTTPTQRWHQRRPLDAGLGFGIYRTELGLGVTPTPLLTCPDGRPSSPIAWCPNELTNPARALADAVAESEREDLVAAVGARTTQDRTVIPIAQLSDVAFIRTDRVGDPRSGTLVGGPLAALPLFTVQS